MPRVLVVNPGSTSTRLALFVEGGREVEVELPCSDDGLSERLSQAVDFLAGNATEIHAVVGRGGLIKPVPSGTFAVTPEMEHDARVGVQGRHPSNLGCLIAAEIGRRHGVPAFIADPVAVDEMLPIARLTGLPEIWRRSLSHALNLHAVTRMACQRLDLTLAESRMVAAHLGGGFSIAAMLGGRIVDVSNANSGGPFSPTRAGALPTQDLITLCFQPDALASDVRRRTTKDGGLRAWLGTDDAREVEARIAGGDAQARLVYESMAYHTAKEIGAMAAALGGGLHAVVLTGGLARSDRFASLVGERVAFLGPLLRFPGAFEMEALAERALRVLTGVEETIPYPGGTLQCQR